MLTEVAQALFRLENSGLSSSRAARGLRQLHNRYSGILGRVRDSALHPQVMRILAEEAVEDLTGRFYCLGIPLEKTDLRPVPLYWRNYIQAIQSGELLDTDYTRFQEALALAAPFLDDSYIQEESLGDDYKTMRYAYALSSLPLPSWFSPAGVMERLEEIVTACGFLWFAIVDYAEEQYITKGA